MNTVRNWKIGRLGGALVISLTLVLPAFVVATESAWGAGCGVYAGTPASPNLSVGGDGGRSGCGSRVSVYVKLKWDRPLSPDPTLQTRSGQFTNVNLHVSHDCLVGTHDYYIETDTSSDQYSSSDPRLTATCS